MEKNNPVIINCGRVWVYVQSMSSDQRRSDARKLSMMKSSSVLQHRASLSEGDTSNGNGVPDTPTSRVARYNVSASLYCRGTKKPPLNLIKLY